MFCRAATSFNGKDCWAPDFRGALAFGDAGFREVTVPVLVAVGLPFATACGEPPSVLFDISGSLGKRSVGVGWWRAGIAGAGSDACSSADSGSALARIKSSGALKRLIVSDVRAGLG